MTKSTTRSLFLAATFAGMVGLAGCAGNGYDSGATTEPATGATEPMTSPAPTSDAMPGTDSMPAAPTPAPAPAPQP